MSFDWASEILSATCEILCYPQYLTIKRLLNFLKGSGVIHLKIRKAGDEVAATITTAVRRDKKIRRELRRLLCALLRFPLNVTSTVCVTGLRCDRMWVWFFTKRGASASHKLIVVEVNHCKLPRNRNGSFVMNYWERHIMNPVSVGCLETLEVLIAPTSNECFAFCIDL